MTREIGLDMLSMILKYADHFDTKFTLLFHVHFTDFEEKISYMTVGYSKSGSYALYEI